MPLIKEATNIDIMKERHNKQKIMTNISEKNNRSNKSIRKTKSVKIINNKPDSVINTMVDKIFVINLQKRQDRWNNLIKQFNYHKITNYERFNAICPSYKDNLIKEQIIDFIEKNGKVEYDLLNNYEKNNYDNLVFDYFNTLDKENKYGLVRGIVGCKASHIEIIKIAKERKYKKIIIIEDDAKICQDFEERIKKIHNFDSYDILYLGVNNHEPCELINENIGRVKLGLSTVAYIIKDNIYDYIIENGMKSGMEIDTFYIKHIQNKGQCYCIIPNMITQTDGISDIESREINH